MGKTKRSRLMVAQDEEVGGSAKGPSSSDFVEANHVPHPEVLREAEPRSTHDANPDIEFFTRSRAVRRQESHPPR